jgi:hypothetical protein
MTNEGISDRRFMNRKYVILGIFAILVVVIASFVYYGHNSSNISPKDTPVPQNIFNVNTTVLNSPMINNQFDPPPNYYTNITQGNDLKVNVTITSTGPEEIVYIKNIQVWWYNPNVNLYTWYSPPNTGNDSSIQTSAFSYSSSPNPVSLQPYMSNSTILTLNIEKNAPTGQYSMYINFEAKPTQTNETSGFMQLDESHWFSIIINPS